MKFVFVSLFVVLSIGLLPTIFSARADGNDVNDDGYVTLSDVLQVLYHVGEQAPARTPTAPPPAAPTSTTTPIPGLPEIAVSIVQSKTQARLSEDLVTFSITAENIGPISAGVWVRIDPGDGFTLVSRDGNNAAEPIGGIYTPSGRWLVGCSGIPFVCAPVCCGVGVDPGRSMQVVVTGLYATRGMKTIRAELLSPPDGNPGNDVAIASVAVP